MKKYELTRPIFGGAEIMQPGEVVDLSDDQAKSAFWRNRVKSVETLEPATPAESGKQDAPATGKKK